MKYQFCTHFENEIFYIKSDRYVDYCSKKTFITNVQSFLIGVYESG